VADRAGVGVAAGLGEAGFEADMGSDLEAAFGACFAAASKGAAGAFEASAAAEAAPSGACPIVAGGAWG